MNIITAKSLKIQEYVLPDQIPVVVSVLTYSYILEQSCEGEICKVVMFSGRKTPHYTLCPLFSVRHQHFHIFLWFQFSKF